MRRFWPFVVVFIGLAAAAAPAQAERRFALVIGNNSYERLSSDQQLRSAVNDAQLMKTTLESLGFTVILKENVRRADLVDALSEFAAKISKDDIALFFYAGHGVALNGANYILPSDVTSPRASGRDEEARLVDNALAETRVIERMKGAGARVSLVVLDACRDNPLAPSGGRSVGGARGLAPPPEAEGLMSIYSAGVGQTAWDRLDEADPSQNSVFTRVFAEVLKTPGLDLQGVARETRRRVADLAKSAGKVQTPGYYEQIYGAVYLAGSGERPTAPPPTDTVAAAQQAAFAVAMQGGSVSALDAFLSQYPSGSLAEIARREQERLKAQSNVSAASPGPSAKPTITSAASAASALQQVTAITPTPAIAAHSTSTVQDVALIPQFRKYNSMGYSFEWGKNVDSVAVSRDNTSVLSLSEGTLKFWDIASGRLSNSIGSESNNSINAFAVSRRTKNVMLGYWDHSTDGNNNTLALRSADGDIVQTYRGHTEHISSVAFSPDERTFISSSSDLTMLSGFRSYHSPLKLWDTASGRLIRDFKGQDAWIASVAFSPNGHSIITGDYNSNVKIWDVSSGRVTRLLNGHSDSVTSVAFSPDGRLVLSGSKDATMKLWDVQSGRLVHTLAGHSAPVSSVCFSADGLSILSGSGDKTIKLWETTSGALVRSFEGHRAEVNGVGFSPDGHSIVSGASDGTTRLWDKESGQLRVTFSTTTVDGKEVWTAFKPNGFFVTSGDPKKLLKISRQGTEFSLDDDFIARHRRENLGEP